VTSLQTVSETETTEKHKHGSVAKALRKTRVSCRKNRESRSTSWYKAKWKSKNRIKTACQADQHGAGFHLWRSRKNHHHTPGNTARHL